MPHMNMLQRTDRGNLLISAAVLIKVVLLILVVGGFGLLASNPQPAQAVFDEDDDLTPRDSFRGDPRPICNISVNRTSVNPGETVTVSWSTSLQDAAGVPQLVQYARSEWSYLLTVNSSGSRQEVVNQDTSFYLRAQNENESCLEWVTVTVTDPQPQPTCTFSASPRTVPQSGGNVTLSWTTTGATQTQINSGAWSTHTNHSMSVWVDSGTEQAWALRAQGPGGEAVCNTAVTVEASTYMCTGNRPANTSPYLGDTWGLTANTPWTYSASNTSAMCEYTCQLGYTWNGSSCAPQTYMCTGTLPANTTVHSNDAINLTSNTSWQYSNSNTARKCEFYCAGGYEWNGTSCAPSQYSPQASISGPTQVCQNSTYTLQGAASDPDGSIVDRQWYYSSSCSGTVQGTGGTHTQNVGSAPPGSTHSRSFRVTDNDGLTACASHQFTILASTDTACTSAPTAPTSVSATPSCSGASPRVSVSWNSVSGATQYQVFRCTGSGCTVEANSTYLVANNLTGTSWTDTGVSANTTYRYAVRAQVNGTWGNPLSPYASATASACSSSGPWTPGASPSCSGTSPVVNVSWASFPDAEMYQVFRCTGSNCSVGTPLSDYLRVNNYGGISWTDTQVSANTTYRYQVRARVGGLWVTPNSMSNHSGNVTTRSSTECQSEPPPPPPTPPECSLSANETSLPEGGGRVTISWSIWNVSDTFSATLSGVTNENITTRSGSLEFEVDETTRFRLNVRDLINDTSGSCTRTVTVGIPAPESLSSAPYCQWDIHPRVTLSWDPIDPSYGPASYRVGRCSDAGCTSGMTVSGFSSATSISHLALKYNPTYFFVQARVLSGGVYSYSGWSDPLPVNQHSCPCTDSDGDGICDATASPGLVICPAGAVSIPVSGTTQLTARYSGFGPASCSDPSVTEISDWSSSSPNAGVSNISGSKGQVTGVNEGTAGVVASYNGLTANKPVTVTESGALDTDPSINSFVATPPLVRQGDDTTLTWELGETPTDPCVLTGGGVNATITNQSGSINSGQISSQTTFTLACGANTATATVNVIPVVQES